MTTGSRDIRPLTPEELDARIAALGDELRQLTRLRRARRAAVASAAARNQDARNERIRAEYREAADISSIVNDLARRNGLTRRQVSRILHPPRQAAGPGLRDGSTAADGVEQTAPPANLPPAAPITERPVIVPAGRNPTEAKRVARKPRPVEQGSLWLDLEPAPDRDR